MSTNTTAAQAGSMPQTTVPPFLEQDKPSATPASNSAASTSTSTTTTASSSNYPPAQPGAAPFPAPTGAPLAPPAPTPTTTRPLGSVIATDTSPAPPQPGAIPQPLTQMPTSTDSSRPPPPQPGEAAAQRAGLNPTTIPGKAYPTGTSPAGSSASTSANLSHPPGYVQDPNADALPASAVGSPMAQSGLNSAIGGGSRDGGILGGGVDGGQTSNNGGGGLLGGIVPGLGETDGEGIWDAAKRLARAAGTKVGEAEEEVWRRINESHK